jgi:hypothetical protein
MLLLGDVEYIPVALVTIKKRTVSAFHVVLDTCTSDGFKWQSPCLSSDH